MLGISDQSRERNIPEQFNRSLLVPKIERLRYEGWNFNSGNYLFTTDTK